MTSRLVALGVVVLGACASIDNSQDGPSGTGGTGGNPGGEDPDAIVRSEACAKPRPGRAPLRRLSNAEYRNAVTDLLGQPALVDQLVSGFVSESESLGFRNNADFLTVPPLVAQQYMAAAEKLSEAASSSAQVVKCTPVPGKERQCASQFIREFALKAYRRPLTDEEIAKYEAVYDNAIQNSYDFKTGVQWVIFALLQSPQFIHRVETGTEPGSGVTRPTHYEMASRLSFLLWQSMPDDALFSAAAAGKLGTPQEIEAQARRLLGDPKAARVFDFYDQWLDLDRLSTFSRDPGLYPGINNATGALLRAESAAFITHLLHDPRGSFTDLLTAPYTFLNAELAKHYGISGPTGAAFERVEIAGRAGILTQGGVIAAHDKHTRTSIVLRGLKIRTDFLCQIVPAPPPDVVTNLEGLDPGLTQREKLALHRQKAACAGCHNLMDPLGVAFEGFDAVGRSRTVDEKGEPIVTRSEITATRDADGPLSGPLEFAQKLAQSEQARDCYATQVFRFFYGRDASQDDICTQARLKIAFRDSGYNLSALLIALTQTDAFLYRPMVNPLGAP